MRPSQLIRLFALACLSTLLLVLLAPGCGRSSLEPESLNDGGTAAACGPSTCPTGCCDASGTCRTGQDTRACGSIGGRCSDCVANGFSLCNSAGVCGRDDPACSPSTCSGCCALDEGRQRCLSGTEPAACGRTGARCASCTAEGRVCDVATRACGTTQCNATNCAGCCVGDKCLPGSLPAACGTAGAQCGSCAPGQQCRAQGTGGGRCEGTGVCGPANCAGCCTAAGQCVTGNDTTACGKQGARCSACGFNQICVAEGLPDARSCQVPSNCGPSNCPGCCVGNQCVIATTPQACGNNGKQCKACGPNMVCSPGSGECVRPSGDCNQVSCGGCCVGDICAVGTQNTACGAGGDVCLNCTNQGRLCQAGVCQSQNCGPATCPNGCCDGNTCVLGTQDDACGSTGGASCSNCTASNQACQDRVCRERCGPNNCSGCCQSNNACVIGVANNACGAEGVACANCAGQNSFCNGLVVPRRCNNAQTTCPASYSSCPDGVATPVTTPLQNACTDVDLVTLGTACADGPDSPACVVALSATAAACSTCLGPFKHPFQQRAGLWACAASFVGQGCRRTTGCAIDCAQTSCNQCLPTSENQCYALVNRNGAQCGAVFNAASCAASALETGQLCSQFSYADYGQWLRAVGDHFCGNGP
jgi:hypothetical protein